MLDDLISRQAAIDAIVNTPSEVQNKNIPLVNQYDGATFRQIEILGIIEALPSAQPEEDCDTCKHGYFGDTCCNNCKVSFPSHYERRTDG